LQIKNEGYYIYFELFITTYTDGVMDELNRALCFGESVLDTDYYGYFNIVFRTDGFEALEGAGADTRVVISYDATIVTGDADPASAADTFVNDAQLYPSATALTDCAPIIDDASYQIGVVSVDKFDRDVYDLLQARGGAVDMTNALLSGATFRVYDSLANAQARTSPVAMVMSSESGATQVNPADRFALVEGQVTCDETEIPATGEGVYLTGELVYGDYWVVETTAPSGYQLDATPVKFTVSETTSWGTNGPTAPACAGADATAEIPVTPRLDTATNTWVTTNDWAVAHVFNTRVPVPVVTPSVQTLPFTGASHVWETGIIGANLLVLGVFFLVLRRRARDFPTLFVWVHRLW
jgi:hypothetical protein